MPVIPLVCNRAQKISAQSICFCSDIRLHEGLSQECGPGVASQLRTYLQQLVRTYLQQLQLVHPHKVIHLQQAATCIQTWGRNKSGKINRSQDAGSIVLTY